MSLRTFSSRSNALATRVLAVKPSRILSLGYSHRFTSTANIEKTSQQAAVDLLINQRKLRPMSPELTIYQPQLTWLMSSLHRITGLSMAIPFYAFTIGYIALPLVGMGFNSASLISAFGGLPIVVKLLTKTVVSLPFTFHIFNGMRHLIWDTARELTIKGVYRTGYTVIGLSLISSVVLAFL